MNSIFTKISGKALLLGNEAVVRGALEAGVQFVSTYPGTPASDIGDNFYKIKQGNKKIGNNFYFEYSVNEKVALEAGMGASFSGLRTLVVMKHFGLNVAQDAFLPFVYSGTVGPTLIVVADDPSCYSSAQSEQNSRFIARMAHIPTLEPSDPQEAKDFTKLGFELSEKFGVPVLLRLTTRVCHQRAIVELEEKIKRIKLKGNFKKNPEKFITMPAQALRMKGELLEKIEKIRNFSEKSKINSIHGKGDVGIIASGVSYLYVAEALKKLGVKIPVLKLGFFYPLPKKKIKKFVEGKKAVLVVEELEGLLEKEVERLAKQTNCALKIHGKDFLPIVGEFNPELIEKALAEFTRKKPEKSVSVSSISVSKRSPRPCPGCPYWHVFGAVKEATSGQNVIFGGDIGCYMLAGIPQLGLQDYLFCMGSSLGVGHGIKQADPSKKLIAFIGDSTFFHAGMPALVNIVMNDSKPLVIIMDNRTTAMTGQQPNPGQQIDIEGVVRGLGIKNVKTVDPKKGKEFKRAISQFLAKDKACVLIARSPCLFIKN